MKDIINEVLFRGFHPDKDGEETVIIDGKKIKGTWYYGDLLRDFTSGIFAIVIYVNLGGDIKDLSEINIFKVIPETVGRATFLSDKNGKKIFEGDIIRLTDEHNEIEWTAVVVFGNPNGEYNWGRQLKAIGEFDGNKDILLWVDMEKSGAYCEIIGNIHDNPELLEGGADNE